MVKNRVAFITGGGKGIGRQIAIRLAQEDIISVVVSRTQSDIEETVETITSSGGRAHGFAADVTDYDKMKEIVEEIENSIGDIDILVNNAGIGDGGGPMWQLDRKQWWRVMEINVRAPFDLIHLIVPYMIERGSGTIVSLSSFAAIRRLAGASPYGISKTAFTRMTEILAVELMGTGISAFSISPGLVYTDMTKNIEGFKDIPKSQWTPIEESAELTYQLTTGKYDKLSGRFIHVNYDKDTMLEKVGKIEDDGLYYLRLPTLGGLEN